MTRKTLFIIALTIIAAFAIAAFAQSGRSKPGKPRALPNSEADTAAVTEVTMVEDIAENAGMMALDFQDMRNNFDEMLQMNDMTELRSAMTNHQRTLDMMQRRLTALKKNCEQLLVLMKTPADSTVRK